MMRKCAGEMTMAVDLVDILPRGYFRCLDSSTSCMFGEKESRISLAGWPKTRPMKICIRKYEEMNV